MARIVTQRNEDEETLKRRIRQLKEREKTIREERHRLEAQLREKIFDKYKKLCEEYTG